MEPVFVKASHKKSKAKLAGVKWVIKANDDVAYISSFGKGNNSVLEKRIMGDVSSNVNKDSHMYVNPKYTEKNYEIKNNEMLDNPYDEVNNLFIEYDSIVHDTIVNDFIRAEQKLVRMMKMVYEQIADDLDFDIIDEDAQ